MDDRICLKNWLQFPKMQNQPLFNFFPSWSPNPEVLDCVQSEKAKLLQEGAKDISLIPQILTDLVLGAKPLGATEQRQGIAIMLTFRK